MLDFVGCVNVEIIHGTLFNDDVFVVLPARRLAKLLENITCTFSIERRIHGKNNKIRTSFHHCWQECLWSIFEPCNLLLSSRSNAITFFNTESSRLGGDCNKTTAVELSHRDRLTTELRVSEKLTCNVERIDIKMENHSW